MASLTVASLQKNRPAYIKPALIAVFILSAPLIVGFVAANEPILAFVIAFSAFFIIASLLWPSTVTLAVIFLLYTNAPAIAVNFHGLPYIVGAIFPFLLVVPLFNYVVLQRQKLIISPLFYIVLIFYLIQLIAVLFTKNINEGFSNFYKSAIEGIVLYIVLVNVVRTKEILYRAVWCLLVAGAIIGALGFYQILSGTYDNSYWGFAQVSNTAFNTGQTTLSGEVTQPRLAGAVGEQNRHAQVMLMLVPLGFYTMWSEKRFWLKLLAASFTALITLGMATTFSRGAALGFVLALLFMTFMGYIKVKQILLVVVGVALLFIVLPQYGTRLLKLEGLVGLLPGGNFSISSTTSPDGALAGRTTSMLTALQVFVDHPLVGVGTGMFKFYYQDYAQFIGPRWEVGTRAAHDLYVGLLAENGLFGFLSFIAIVIISMRMLAQTRKSLIKTSPLYANIATGFIFSIATYLGTGIGLHFGYYRFFWLIMALAFAAAHVANESLPVPNSPNKNILVNSPFNRVVLTQGSDQSL